MVKRGNDSWNKAMLVDPQGNPSRPNKKMRSSVKENNARNEDELMSEKDMRHTGTNKSNRSIKSKTEPVPERKMENSGTTASERSNKNTGGATSERNMRNAGAMTARNNRATNAMSNTKKTDSSNSGRNRKKTPLEAFDVKAFFEENLYDIIDLEENRSGVREFEDAVKRDE